VYVGDDELVGYAHQDFVSELTLLQQGKCLREYAAVSIPYP
jgi:hypothetical protein